MRFDCFSLFFVSEGGGWIMLDVQLESLSISVYSQMNQPFSLKRDIT